jgi:hypothetical protein
MQALSVSYAFSAFSAFSRSSSSWRFAHGFLRRALARDRWIPACAGMTPGRVGMGCRWQRWEGINAVARRAQRKGREVMQAFSASSAFPASSASSASSASWRFALWFLRRARTRGRWIPACAGMTPSRRDGRAAGGKGKAASQRRRGRRGKADGLQTPSPRPLRPLRLCVEDFAVRPRRPRCRHRADRLNGSLRRAPRGGVPPEPACPCPAPTRRSASAARARTT